MVPLHGLPRYHTKESPIHLLPLTNGKVVSGTYYKYNCLTGSGIIVMTVIVRTVHTKASTNVFIKLLFYLSF